MRYENPCEGIFVDRPNRFIAHVEIGGRQETVHVKNTGRCRELLLPGRRVVLNRSGNPKRKTALDSFATRGLELSALLLILRQRLMSLRQCRQSAKFRSALNRTKSSLRRKVFHFTANPFFRRNSRTNGRRSRLRMPEIPLIQVSSRGLRLRAAKYSRMRAS